jgi:esterase/lipase
VGIDEFRLWGKRHHIDFDRLYKEVKEHPKSIEMQTLGHTYKYWASILPVDPMQSLKKVTIPIFVAIGENDDSIPVESVHFMRAEFEMLNKKNLTVKIFPDCDHVLNSSKGVNYRNELFKDVTKWLDGDEHL